MLPLRFPFVRLTIGSEALEGNATADTSQTRGGNAISSFVSLLARSRAGQMLVTACRDEVGGKWDRRMVIHYCTM